MSDQLSGANSQINRIEMLCHFLEHPALTKAAASASPVTMPATISSMGFDVPTWVGFGLVGLWAALDAYADRSGLRGKCGLCARPGCLVGRLATTGRISSTQQVVLYELEDLRHLFAHNFAGHADAGYFIRKRHTLVQGQSLTLSCGAMFNGARVELWSGALQHYATSARAILESIK